MLLFIERKGYVEVSLSLNILLSINFKVLNSSMQLNCGPTALLSLFEMALWINCSYGFIALVETMPEENDTQTLMFCFVFLFCRDVSLISFYFYLPGYSKRIEWKKNKPIVRMKRLQVKMLHRKMKKIKIFHPKHMNHQKIDPIMFFR